jgi:acyl carrier protein
VNAAFDSAKMLLAEALGLPVEAVPADACADDIDAWDSLAHMRLVLSLEARLGRQLAPEIILSITTLNEIAALLG